MIEGKHIFKGELLLYPCPTVLVSTKTNNIDNVLAVSWAGIASSHPEYVTIAINTKRFSYELIKASHKFCINIPEASMVHKVDYCGTYSGREKDKFCECNFTKQYLSEYVIIKECPMHIMCEVEHEYPLGSHVLFVSKVVGKLLDDSIENVNKDLCPLVYFRPYYYQLDKTCLGSYGYTRKLENKK